MSPSPAPGTVEARPQATPSAGATSGVGAKRVARERRMQGGIDRRPRPLATESPISVQVRSADERDRRRVCGSGTAPPKIEELETPSTAGGRLAAAAASGDRCVESAPAPSWPRSGPGHEASVRKCGTLGRQTRGGITPVASLCCRALVSPPPTTSPQQGLRRRVRRGPTAAGRGAAVAAVAAAMGAEQFVGAAGVSDVGSNYCSPPSGAVVIVSAGAAAGVCSRGRNRTAPRSRETKPHRGVLNSRSAAALLVASSNPKLVAAGNEGIREQTTPAADLRGAGGTSRLSTVGTKHPDDGSNVDSSECRNCRRDGCEDNTRKLDHEVLSTGLWACGETGRGPKPSEVPESSPMTSALPFAVDGGTNRDTGQSGDVCGVLDGDTGFRVGDARQQAVHGGGGGGGGGQDGGSGKGSGSGNGNVSGGNGNVSGGSSGGGGVGQPFAQKQAAREERGSAFGEGASESDEKLVALLRERPKKCPQVGE